MFYFDNFNGKKVLRSSFVSEANAFFSTREGMPEIKTRIISPQQTHSDHVEIVDQRLEYPDTDALILTNPDDTICLRFADCTPLIFYDTKQKIGAIAHAGWRGTAAKIGVKTIKKMGVNFGTDPRDITTLIGPAIGICCYEVSEEVRDKLLETVNDTTGLCKGRNVDLKRINARQLEEIGVQKIDICPYCTSCNNDLFYSYRKENGTTERHYAVLQIHSEISW